MNPYQKKWLELLESANLPNWTIKPLGDDIYINMPSLSDLKLIRDNLPQTLAAMSLDINLPHQRLKFIFRNGYENFEYVLNPDAKDLNERE